MKRALKQSVWIAFAFTLFGCASRPAPVVAAPPAEALYAPGDYYVEKVVDGDTVWLRKDDQTVKVRLLRIDAPEMDEYGYQEATEELQRQIGDESRVHLEFEEERLDPHGRTLAYVFVDGKNVNLSMVETGWSPFFDRYGTGKYAAEFRLAESRARKDRLGIWANR